MGADALTINLLMNGNVGHSRSRGRENDGDEPTTTPTSRTISPADKLFLRSFGVVYGTAMAIVTIVAVDSGFVLKGIFLAASLFIACFPFAVTRDDA